MSEAMTSREKQFETQVQTASSGVLGIAGKHASKKRVALLVAGMHRSGTSALTRTLHLLGCGLPENLVPASKNDNELGFWESKPVADLNEEILKSAGSFWNDWLPFPPDWYRLPIAEAFQERAEQILENQFGDSTLFVLKDPRICRLLPFWIRAVENCGAAPVVVLPIRNPLEVAASLKKRNGMEIADAQLFWLRHVLDAEVLSRDLPRVFVRYDDLLSNWRNVAERVSDALGVSWPRRSETSDAEIGTFLSSSQRHNFVEDAAIFEDRRLSPWIKDAYEVFQRWSSGAAQSEADMEVLNRIRDALNDSALAFEQVVLLQRNALRQNKQDQRDLAARGEEVKNLRSKLEDQSHAVDAARAEIGILKEEIAKREKELQVIRSTASQEEFREKLEIEKSRRAEAESEVAELRERLETTKSALVQRQAEARETSQQLTVAQARIEGVQAGVGDSLSNLHSMIEAEHDKRVEAEVRAFHLQDRLEKAENETRRLKAIEEEAAVLREEKRRADRAALGLKEHVDFLIAEVKSHRDVREKEEKTIAALRAAEQKASAALAKRDEEVARLRKESERVRQELGVARAELDVLKALAVGQPGGRGATLSSAILERVLPRRLRQEGRIFLLRRSKSFDAEWYLEQNPDVAAEKMDPVRHFVLYGESEGRAPNALGVVTKKNPSSIG